eukprot:1160146-Pelagomonas_calceolata.AAC.15
MDLYDIEVRVWGKLRRGAHDSTGQSGAGAAAKVRPATVNERPSCCITELAIPREGRLFTYSSTQSIALSVRNDIGASGLPSRHLTSISQSYVHTQPLQVSAHALRHCCTCSLPGLPFAPAYKIAAEVMMLRLATYSQIGVQGEMACALGVQGVFRRTNGLCSRCSETCSAEDMAGALGVQKVFRKERHGDVAREHARGSSKRVVVALKRQLFHQHGTKHLKLSEGALLRVDLKWRKVFLQYPRWCVRGKPRAILDPCATRLKQLQVREVPQVSIALLRSKQTSLLAQHNTPGILEEHLVPVWIHARGVFKQLLEVIVALLALQVVFKIGGVQGQMSSADCLLLLWQQVIAAIA